MRFCASRLTLKSIAQAAREAAFPPGSAYLFFWGLEIAKFIF
jgi:hypothetical protein